MSTPPSSNFEALWQVMRAEAEAPTQDYSGFVRLRNEETDQV
jgi:hypothetical protein